jgi:hypothetical protein
MVATREIMLEIASELQGTTRDLEDVLKEHGLDFTTIPKEMLEILDDQVKLCDQCGWWDDVSEFDDNNICENCREDE